MNIETKLVLNEHSIKRHAKRLQNEMLQYNQNFKLSHAQDMLSKIFGMNNWHELKSILAKNNDLLSKIIFDEKNTDILKNISILFEDSDVINIVSESPIKITNSKISNLEVSNNVSNKDIVDFIKKIGSENIYAKLLSGIAVDFLYQADNNRYRVNCYRNLNDKKIYVTLKKVNVKKTSLLEKIYFNKNVLNVMQKQYGLNLICGETASGKTMFIEALIEYVSADNKKKIITYKEPIEYNYGVNNVIQLIKNTDIIADYIKSSMRLNPDIIMVGEIKDADTLTETTIAATSGTSVFGSLITKNIVESIIKIKKNSSSVLHIKNTLNSINIIINQKLIYSDITNGILLAQEYLIFNPIVVEKIMLDIKNLELLEKTVKLLIDEHGESMNNSIEKFIKDGLISIEQAKKYLD